MALGLVSPLLNRGVRSRWLASLPVAGSKMLTIDSNGDTSFQDIPSASWGSITGTLSAQTDLQNALNAKLSLTGGTLTGAVTSNLGTVTSSTPALSISQTWNNAAATFSLLSATLSNTASNNDSYWVNFQGSDFWGGNNTPVFRVQGFNGQITVCGKWGDGSIRLGGQSIGCLITAVYGTGLTFAVQGATNFTIGTHGQYGNNSIFGNWHVNNSLAFTGSGFAGYISWDASNVLALKNSTNAQTFRLYGTYTDASNYRRLYLSSTTAGAFTIGVEGAGTGASGNTLNIGPGITIDRGGFVISVESSLILATTVLQLNSDTGQLRGRNGRIILSDNATGSTFDLLRFGGITNSFPAIKRNGTALNFRLADDSADAPITAGAGTFSGNIQTTGYVQVGSDSARVRLTQNGISNLSSGLQYNLISWTGGIIIDAIKISGYAYRGINIERVAGQGGQTWLTVNLEGNSAAFGDTPRQALDVRGNAIIDGNVVLHRSATSTSLQVHNTYTDASNYIRQSLSFTTYSSTVHAQIAAEGAGTGAVNVPFVITPRGTGAFILGPMPNGTATGGNARGANAVDLVYDRTSASHVATGASSFQVGRSHTTSGVRAACVGGDSNTAYGDDSVILGGIYNSTTVPTSSLLSGMRGSTYLQGQSVIAFGGRPFNAQNITGGQCQSYILTLSGYTTDTTQTRMRGGDTGDTWNNYQRITIRSGYTLSALVCIKGIKSDGTAIARFWRFVDITRIGNATTLDVAAETIGTDRNPSACTITIQADDTNEALEILVGGVANETWRWTGTIYGTEIKYGT